MSGALYLRLMVRESRGLRGRLLFFVLCLSIGVAAVVALAGVSSGLEQGIRGEARTLLAADVVVDGQRPPPPELDELLKAAPGVARSDTKRMATIVTAPGGPDRPGPSQLAQLKVVDGTYPFYGKLGLDPDRPLASLLDAGSVVVAPEMLRKLGIEREQTLRIGGKEFRVAATVLSEPDRMDFGFGLGPRVFLSPAGLERTELVSRGSRVFYRVLLKLPDGAGSREATSLAERIKKALPPGRTWDVETYVEAQPALREGLKRAEKFLGLVALLSLLIGGIGVAQTVRSWLAGRMDSIAVQKCLGMRPREVVTLYLGQTLLLALAGSLAGAVTGTALLVAAPRLLWGLLLRLRISPWQPAAVARGVVLGVAIALLFALPQILATRRVPPLRVLRRDVEPLREGRLVRVLLLALLVGGVFGTAVIQSRSLRLGTGFTLGLSAVVGVLALSAWGLARVVGHAPRRWARVYVRHGLASLARPGADTLGTIVALGLGTLVVLAMHLVEGTLERSLEADLPKEAPTAFLVDIEPEQWDGIRSILDDEGATNLRSVPIVAARLVSVDGTSVEDLAAKLPKERGSRRWALTREQNLTYLDDLPQDNTILEGRWWNGPGTEASVEEDFARDLGAKVGSTLGFDVQGVRFEVRVTSLRRVEWRSFRPNFFLVVSPGVLERAPQLRVAAARFPDGREQAVQDRLVGAYPNVILIQIREVLEKVASVVSKVGRGIRFLGGFTMLSGIAILAGAVGAGSVRRGREVALLKTLGMTRLGVVAVFAVEYALVGLVAGIIGTVGGGILAWAILTRFMELRWSAGGAPFAAAVCGCTVLAVVSGTLASARALTRRPVEVLRTE